MPVMPFLSRRRSALDVLTANVKNDNKLAPDLEPSRRPVTATNLAVPSQSSSNPPRPASVYGTTFASSRLSHEVRREDIPDSPTHESEKRRSKRFSMLKMRNFSESQLAIRAQVEADNDIPPMPALPAASQPIPPAIIKTAPTTDMDKPVTEGRTIRAGFSRPVSRKQNSSTSTTSAPRKSTEITTTAPKKTSMRWRKRQGKSTGLDDLLALANTASASSKLEAPPAYDADDASDLAIPVNRFSESSRSDDSHASSSEHIYGSTTTTTHTVSTQTTFFRLRRQNKNQPAVFPLPVKIPHPDDPAIADDPATPHASSIASRNDDDIDPRTTLAVRQRAESQGGSPTKRNTIIAPNQLQSPLSFGQSLVRRASQRSRNSSTSSPLQPPMRLGLRDRASTTSSFGRGSFDTPPLIGGSTRNSTSTTGARSSLAGFLNLTRLRQDSDTNSPGSRSKSNSFALSREALVIPEREEGDTPSKYLERLESTVARSMIATILSKSSDPFAQAVLRSYTRRFAFFGEPIDMSLRKFLLEAELPKETQQVDRVVQAFADRYHECNPGVFLDSDQAYIIAFSLMMLHTDVFNKNNKRKMQKQDYIKNTSGQRVSSDVLGCFFDNISYTPFVHYEEEVDINGERVLPFKPKKIKMKVPPSDVARKTSGPVDPYNLLVEQKLDALRPSLKDSITIDDPYNYLSDGATLDVKALQRAFTHTGVLQIISARSRPTAYEGHFNQAGAAPVETEAGIISLKITKVGTLWRKAARKKKARSPWQEWGAILTGSQLYLFKNAHWAKGLLSQFASQQKPGAPRVPVTFKPPLSDFKPDALIKTDDAVALVDATYTRHKHAFTFVRHGGQEEIFLADNDIERNDWLSLINYAAAFRAAGVRIRGMLGVSDDEARTSRRASVTSSNSANDGQVATLDAVKSRKLDAQLTKQVMAARRQIMIQRLVEAERDIANMNRQLEDMIRDARHLLILAPIAAKTREDLIFAAARADANITWIRRDIWRVKSCRDIIALDVQEDGISADELQAMVKKLAAEAEKSKDTRKEVVRMDSQRSAPRESLQMVSVLSRSTSVRDAVDEYVNDVFRSTADTATSPQTTEGWRLPPLQLDVTSDDRDNRVSVISAVRSVYSQPSDRRGSTSQASANEMLAVSAPARATTPAPSTVGTDSEAQEATPLPQLDGTKGQSPESTKHRTSVRRSLQKTLREVHHQPSVRGHRRGKESESTVRSREADGDDDVEGTPGLERAKGRFILHGKQASVIEFGDDWPNERMKMRREAYRNSPRTPRSSDRSRTVESGSVAQELNHDTTDEEHDNTGSSAAQSFVESAELADQYAGNEVRHHDMDSTDDDETPFYDLSSWDPENGRRSVIGPSTAAPIAESDDSGPGAEASLPDQLDAIDEQDSDSDFVSSSHSNRRTVIGPSTTPKASNDDWLTKSFDTDKRTMIS